MKNNWKNWIFKKAVPALRKPATPLPVKELAFRAIRFAVACGRSHPVSFALRPVAMHRSFRTAVGIGMAAGAILVARIGPVPGGVDAAMGGPVNLVNTTGGQDIELVTRPGVKVPLRNYEISQKFWGLHSGIDMRAPLGEEITPIMSGRVKKAEKNWFGYGNMIIVTHSPEYESLYAHMSKIRVVVGQEVSQDTVLGEVGSTGRSTGPHLHLEITENGKYINPAPILGIK
jgi:murein DD-endopeptidase MepM/ murein hydrolase activator NlpD